MLLAPGEVRPPTHVAWVAPSACRPVRARWEGQAAGTALCLKHSGSQDSSLPVHPGTQEGSIYHGWAGAHCRECVLVTIVTGISWGWGPNLILSEGNDLVWPFPRAPQALWSAPWVLC